MWLMVCSGLEKPNSGPWKWTAMPVPTAPTMTPRTNIPTIPSLIFQSFIATRFQQSNSTARQYPARTPTQAREGGLSPWPRA
jgi:hypothetical protein